MALVLSSVKGKVLDATIYTVGAAGVAGNLVADAVSQSGSALKKAGNAAKGAAGSAVAGAVSQGGNALKYAGTAAKVAAGATVGATGGAGAVSTAAVAGLKLAGFSSVGPTAGSIAASWMSSVAIANGGAVPAMSLYSAVQATAMTSGLVIAAPTVLAVGAGVGAVAGVGVAVYKTCF